MEYIIVTEWIPINAFGIRDNYYEISRYGEVRIIHSGQIMKLRSQTFRKDITLKYRF